jgi:hypothetical protein
MLHVQRSTAGVHSPPFMRSLVIRWSWPVRGLWRCNYEEMHLKNGFRTVWSRLKLHAQTKASYEPTMDEFGARLRESSYHEDDNTR